MIVSIIIVLIVALIVIALWVSAVQQHKEKQEAERRKELTKQKAIIDETEEILTSLASFISSSNLVNILNKRSLIATKAMVKILPDNLALVERVKELEALMDTSKDNSNQEPNEKDIPLPDNEQQLVGILQCIKKLRTILKSEQNKAHIELETFTDEDQKRLVACAEVAKNKNIPTLISNHYVDFTKELYKNSNKHKLLQVQRSISQKGKGRIKVQEILALYK